MKKAYLQLHLAVFLWGFTAILGALISLHAIHLVWWRVLLASASLFLLIGGGRKLKYIPKKYLLYFLGIGIIVALHWITFFWSIKIANASIALVSLATASFFTSLMEPLIVRRKLKPYELLLGILIVPGMVLIVNHTELNMQFGIVLGLISAFLVSLFSALNKRFIGKADDLSITFLEMSGAWLFITLMLPFLGNQIDYASFFPRADDWIYLLILSFVCTTFAYVLGLKALHHLSAFASSLIINLEPVYGIILAWLILKENKELSTEFYLGVGLIVLVVFCYPFVRKRIEGPRDLPINLSK